MMNILLSSVGRRPYLVRWFRDALLANGIEGQVIAADVDPLSPARAFADDFVQAPPVTDPRYRRWLGELLTSREIGVAVSINDFELSEWAHLPVTDEWEPLVRLSAAGQQLVEDKYLMSTSFTAPAMPRTWLGGDAQRALEESRGGGFVVKGRFGSASRGLGFCEASGLADAVAAATAEVTDRRGVPALLQKECAPRDLVIIQDRIHGPEYGLDVVNDLDGNFAGVLARRKIAMRAGETDRAETVDASAFERVAREIAVALGHVGSIDVDVMVDGDVPYVIDVNPRFGGGYPFSHLAGARVPDAYVAWAAGQAVPADWLRAEAGVISGKFVDTVQVSGPAPAQSEPAAALRASVG